MTHAKKKSHKKGITSHTGLFVRNDTHCRSFQAKNHILNSRRIKFRLMKKIPGHPVRRAANPDTASSSAGRIIPSTAKTEPGLSR